MALSKMSELRDLSADQVSKKIQQLKRELFDLRFQAATRQAVQPHQAKQLRHQIAQLMTLQQQRQQG